MLLLSAALAAHQLRRTCHADAHLAVMAQLNALVQRRLQDCVAWSNLQHHQACFCFDFNTVRTQASLRAPLAIAAGPGAALGWKRRQRPCAKMKQPLLRWPGGSGAAGAGACKSTVRTATHICSGWFPLLIINNWMGKVPKSGPSFKLSSRPCRLLHCYFVGRGPRVCAAQTLENRVNRLLVSTLPTTVSAAPSFCSRLSAKHILVQSGFFLGCYRLRVLLVVSSTGYTAFFLLQTSCSVDRRPLTAIHYILSGLSLGT